MAPLGRRTHSERKTLELKLAIHFPNSVVTEEMATTVDAGRAKCCDWWVATRDVTHRRVEWAGQLILLPHIKGQEWMVYSRPCYKRDRELSFAWSGSSVLVWQLVVFQPFGIRLR